MSGPPDRPHHPYPASPPYATPSAVGGPGPGSQWVGTYPPPLPALPPYGPRPWSGIKMLFLVWGSTALAGPFVGALFGAVIAASFSYLLRGTADAEVFEVLLGASVTFAFVLGGLIGGAVGIAAGLAGGAAASLLFTRLPPSLTGLVSGLLAGVSIVLGVVLLAAVGGSDVNGGGLVLLLVPTVLVVLVEFLIVLLAARGARRAAQRAGAGIQPA